MKCWCKVKDYCLSNVTYWEVWCNSKQKWCETYFMQIYVETVFVGVIDNWIWHAIFWDVMPCRALPTFEGNALLSPSSGSRHKPSKQQTKITLLSTSFLFVAFLYYSDPLAGGHMFFQNVSKHLRDCIASHPMTLYSHHCENLKWNVTGFTLCLYQNHWYDSLNKLWQQMVLILILELHTSCTSLFQFYFALSASHFISLMLSG
jgi:hypothetical protein